MTMPAGRVRPVTTHTAHLSSGELAAIHELLEEAFDGDITDDDSSTRSAACTRWSGRGVASSLTAPSSCGG